MPEREDEPRYVQNFALYNAPPGTVQKMGVYFYASPDAGEPARQAVLAFTHGDAFKPIPGYKTFVNHFHLDFTGRQRASGSLDTPFQDLIAMRSIGLNVIGLSDFHFELHAQRPWPAAASRTEGLLRRLAARVGQGFPGGAVGRAERVLRRPLQHPVAEGCLLDQSATAGTAVRRGGGGLRQGVSHGQRRGRAGDDGRGGRVLVSRAPADEEHHRLSRSDLGQAVREERSISGSRVQAGHGSGQLRSPDVRLALLRCDRHHEQHVRGFWRRAEVRHRRHRHLSRRAPKTICMRTSRSTT